MTQIGRNEPCLCGSGKKYKKCCLGQETTAAKNSAAGVSAELQQAMAGHEFNSLEEAQTFAESFMEQRNQKSFDDFHGLSPDQMYHVLNFPFTSPHLVNFPEKLESVPDAPILSLFNLLIEAIGEKGLKPTAKGNLPRNFCREAALAYWDEETYQHYTGFGNVNKEEDFFELHVARVVAELAGLILHLIGGFAHVIPCAPWLTLLTFCAWPRWSEWLVRSATFIATRLRSCLCWIWHYAGVSPWKCLPCDHSERPVWSWELGTPPSRGHPEQGTPRAGDTPGSVPHYVNFAYV